VAGWRRGCLWHRRSERRGAFGTVEQKDVVAAGTVRKSWFCTGKYSISAFSHQSSVISPVLKGSDPVLEFGDGRCAGDMPRSTGCAASRPRDHTPGGAVPSGTVSDPEVKTRPPRYMVAEVFFSSDGGISAWTDSLRPELPPSGTIMGVGLDGILERSPAGAENAENVPEVQECCAAVEDENVFLCAQEFSPELWEAFLNVPLLWGAIMDLPLTQGGPPAQGAHAENSPKRFLAPREVPKGS